MIRSGLLLTIVGLTPAVARAQFVDQHFRPIATPPPAGDHCLGAYFRNR